MTTFSTTVSPTPFSFFDSDTQFQSEADNMINFVKRKLGDDVLSVELTKKEIWACFEEACCEYSKHIHEMKILSELSNILGMPTGSTDLTNKYTRNSLEFLLRMSDAYATEAYVGGAYNAQLGYFNTEKDKQDYDIYKELKDATTDAVIYQTIASGSKGKLKIVELFHFEPIAAQHFLLNASNTTNYLATNFNYESYVNSTVFHVLPVFEDVLRRSMLETAFRVRRSQYSYQIIGSKLRLFPIPTLESQIGKVYCKVMEGINPINPTAYTDDSIYGVSGPENAPYGNIPFKNVTQPGRQWIRQYTLALSRELLGLIRSKFQSIPIPNAELQLNGESLVTTGREDKDKLVTQLKEFLSNLTRAKMLESDALTAENMNKNLRYIPMPLGKSVIIG
jgi:hypothetical protein